MYEYIHVATAHVYTAHAMPSKHTRSFHLLRVQGILSAVHAAVMRGTYASKPSHLASAF